MISGLHFIWALACCYTTAVQTCWLVAARRNLALWHSCECQRAAILHVLQDLPAGLAQLPRLAFIGSHYCVSFVFVNDLKVLAEGNIETNYVEAMQHEKNSIKTVSI